MIMMKYNEDLKNYELMNTVVTSLIDGKKVVVYEKDCAVSIDNFVRYFVFNKPLRKFKLFLLKNIFSMLSEKFNILLIKKVNQNLYVILYQYSNHYYVYLLKLRSLRSKLFELKLEVGKDVNFK